MKKIALTLALVAMLAAMFVVPASAAVETGGNAWIGGTFLVEDGSVDWVAYEDQKTAFSVGEPFTVKLSLGGEGNTHSEASWGYISVVQTDMMSAPSNFEAFIYDIKVDGGSIAFNPDNLEVGTDNGIRVSLTNGWSSTPLVASTDVIGHFNLLEVTMVFLQPGSDVPALSSGTGTGDTQAPAPGGGTTTAPTNPATGDDILIFVALGALALCATSAIVLVKKSKA